MKSDEAIRHELDGALVGLRSAEPESAFLRLLAFLDGIRQRADDEWAGAIHECRGHPLAAFFRDDPYTRRAFEKPRGYAGDAVMLDYVYDRDAGPLEGDAATSFRLTADVASLATSTRHRRDHFASVIDEEILRSPRAAIASLASGHLREAGKSEQITPERPGRLVAFDADELSLGVVKEDYGHLPVEAHQGSIADLIRGRIDLGHFDCVYSAGLFDYLSDKLAERLVGRMAEMLNPGGRAIIANFVPTCQGAAYLEAFMDWFLVYRDEADLEALTRRVDPGQIAGMRTWIDPPRNVAYLEFRRV